VPAGLRSWLARALQLDRRDAFVSTNEAQEELDKVMGDGDYLAAPSAVQEFLARYHACVDPTKERTGPQRVATPVVAPRPTAPGPAPRQIPPEAVAPPHVVIEPVAPAAVTRQVPLQPLEPLVAQRVAMKPPAPLEAESFAWPVVPEPVVSPQRVEPPLVVSEPVPQDVSPPIMRQRSPEPIAVRPVLAEWPSAAANAPTTVDRPPEPVRAAWSGTPVPYTVPAHVAKEPNARPSTTRRGGRYRAAIAASVILLLAGGGTLAGRRYLSAAPVTTGTVAVNTNPSGAQVVLDGQPQGLTPTTLTVKAGAHVLELRGAGDPRTISLNVAAGAQLSQYIELSKTPLAVGSLQVRTEPTRGQISVDGVPRGSSPLTISDLSPGEHSVVVEGEGGSTKHVVNIEGGATATLVAQLLAAPSGPSSGWISVSAPKSVELFENGHLLGSSDTDRLMVSTGAHQLDIVNDELGYRTTKNVQVAPGKVSSIKVEFPKGTIALNAVPWAEVWIDGEKMGETPIGNLPVTIGTHEIIFRHPDFGERRHVTTVTLTTPARLSVDMRKP